jgi:hypothetical protein
LEHPALLRTLSKAVKSKELSPHSETINSGIPMSHRTFSIANTNSERLLYYLENSSAFHQNIGTPRDSHMILITYKKNGGIKALIQKEIKLRFN